ncbi:transporter [Thiomicrospira pelophila]|uniref:transporter n=1 Tax=Thiomicrospira pelophila TaxID=934 RepID=UPI0004A6BA23|nr:transporter [Thiomicrospira pelophila]
MNRFFKAMCLLLVPAWVQAEGVVADRPGFSTGTHTLAPGQLNVEMGYQADMWDSNTLHTAPLLNLRTGLAEDLELGIAWAGYQVFDGESSQSDVTLALKKRITMSADYNLSALAQLDLPTGDGSDNFSETRVLGGLLWDKALQADWGLFGVLQAESNYRVDERELNLQAAIGTNQSHSEKIGSYVEVLTDVPLTYSGDAVMILNAGLTYLFDANTQLDVYMGGGLENSDTDFIGFGFARLF